MATNLKIEESLLNEALRVGGLRTKRDTVNLALKEFVDRRRQLEALKLEGQIEFDPGYDYREQRNHP
jgi:Arc/MetJ family transcription regulator